MATPTSILTAHQRAVLDVVAGEEYLTKRYYLAGGTALAEFHLKHRYSEDLDFFIETEEVDPKAIERFWKKHLLKLGITKIETKNVFGLYQYFLYFKDKTTLKVDFSYYPFPRIEKGLHYKKLSVDSAYDITVNKVHTVMSRRTARDFIDIYFAMLKYKYLIPDLVLQAKVKFDWHISAMELGARMRDAQSLTDFPRMIKPIDHNEWKNFFVSEAAKLKKDIFE